MWVQGGAAPERRQTRLLSNPWLGPPGPGAAGWHRGLTLGRWEPHGFDLEGNPRSGRAWNRGGEAVCLQRRKRRRCRARTFGQNAPPSKRGVAPGGVAVGVLLTTRRKSESATSGPSGMVGVDGGCGQWRGQATARAPNCCHQQPVASDPCPEQFNPSGLTFRYPGIRARTLQLTRAIPYWDTRFANYSPRFHVTSHQESQPMASASGLPSIEWAFWAFLVQPKSSKH